MVVCGDVWWFAVVCGGLHFEFYSLHFACLLHLYFFFLFDSV